MISSSVLAAHQYLSKIQKLFRESQNSLSLLRWALVEFFMHNQLSNAI